MSSLPRWFLITIASCAVLLTLAQVVAVVRKPIYVPIDGSVALNTLTGELCAKGLAIAVDSVGGTRLSGAKCSR